METSNDIRLDAVVMPHHGGGTIAVMTLSGDWREYDALASFIAMRLRPSCELQFHSDSERLFVEVLDDSVSFGWLQYFCSILLEESRTTDQSNEPMVLDVIEVEDLRVSVSARFRMTPPELIQHVRDQIGIPVTLH